MYSAGVPFLFFYLYIYSGRLFITILFPQHITIAGEQKQDVLEGAGSEEEGRIKICSSRPLVFTPKAVFTPNSKSIKNLHNHKPSSLFEVS